MMPMSFLHKFSTWYFNRKALPYWAIVLADSLIILMAYAVTYLIFRPQILRWADFGLSAERLQLLGWISLRFLFFPPPYLIGMRIFKTYADIFRYSSFIDLLRVMGMMSIGGVLAWMLHYPLFVSLQFYLQNERSFEANIRTRDILVATISATFLLWFTRMIVKSLYELSLTRAEAKTAFIYGVKGGGISIAKSIRNMKPQQFDLRGFITDDKSEAKHILMGQRVYFLDDKLIPLMKERGIQVLLVSPLCSNALRQNQEFQDALIEADIRILMMPKAEEWKEGDKIQPLKEVKIEDLLPRNEIQVDMDAVGTMLRGKSILITGSAGSIGSEMVRQIAIYNPKQMILIDQAETPQHDVRLMMKNEWPDIETETIVTSICHRDRIEQIFKTYRPDYVFHAAAYKHVPMMESNPSEAVQNNIEGTRIIADMSVKYGVKKFVMISTDKAVNPTNVMGCSKRICEIYVQSLNRAEKNGIVEGQTQFVTTRFGNVLGSNGSVIPLFRRQIQAGGPVTVTHPDIIRFFMLIPEACKLVLEAGTHGKGGEIFVFDMGKPVRIADMAKRMIKMSGAKGVEIKYTGLRDGEKLYEEVLNDEEESKPTFHKKIRIAAVREYDYKEAQQQIDALVAASHDFNDMETVRIMKQIVPEYKSQHSKYEELDKATEVEPN